MERIIGSTKIKDIPDGGFQIFLGGVNAQRTEEQTKDLLYLLAETLNLIVVEDEDMKRLVATIDENNSIPLRKTSNNNVFTGESISTEDLFELNKTLKK